MSASSVTVVSREWTLEFSKHGIRTCRTHLSSSTYALWLCLNLLPRYLSNLTHCIKLCSYQPQTFATGQPEVLIYIVQDARIEVTYLITGLVAETPTSSSKPFMFRGITHRLRSSVTACHQHISIPHTRLTTFLYPSASMSRRSSRLSGNLDASFSSNPLTQRTTLSTEAGPSKLPSRCDTETSLPYFEEWSTEDLQAEVKRYGFKVSRKRTTLIDQLKAVYEALHQSNAKFELPATTLHSDNEVTPAETLKVPRMMRKLVLPDRAITAGAAAVNGERKGKGRKSDPFVLDASSESDASGSSRTIIEAATTEASAGAEEEAGEFTVQLEAEALSATDGSLSPSPSLGSNASCLSATTSTSKPRRGRPRSRSPSTSSSSDIPLALAVSESTEMAVEPTPALAETMTRAIRGNSAVWERILRYEPISFDELVSIATQNGLEMDTGKRKEELKTWLDRQCICFFSNDLTGPRSRH